MSLPPIAIVSAQRTPIGAYLGQFSSLSAPQLLAACLKQQAPIWEPCLKDYRLEMFVGCVLSAGLGQAPARQAALLGGLPASVPSTTLNKVCGSGLEALRMGQQMLCLKEADVVLAAGMESMSRAPYLLEKARSGYRMGHSKLVDHLFYDGLEDPYNGSALMGVLAEKCAQKYSFSREQQDLFSLHSLEKARQAMEKGLFKHEIVPVALSQGMIEQDECPLKARPEKIPSLKAVFSAEGTITAATASGMGDAAAALILMSRECAENQSLPVLAYMVGSASHAQDPAWFSTAPIGAIQQLLKKLDWSIDSVDLWEINEAFAVVTMAAAETLAIPLDKINVHGGACALGHPLGATGARMVTTLLHALAQRGLKRGIAAACIGGGEALALAFERP